MLWHTDRALFKRLSASNPIMIPLTSWPVSSNSSCTYPIYLWICPMTISEARPRLSSMTRIVFLFLLMARMSMGTDKALFFALISVKPRFSKHYTIILFHIYFSELKSPSPSAAIPYFRCCISTTLALGCLAASRIMGVYSSMMRFQSMSFMAG